MPIDAAYQMTRRVNTSGTLTQIVDTSADPETGVQIDIQQVTSIRRLVKEKTSHKRWYRANTTQTEIGDTTFIFLQRDAPLLIEGAIQQEDYVTFNGARYEVVSADFEGTAIIITARRMFGDLSRPAPLDCTCLLLNWKVIDDFTETYAVCINATISGPVGAEVVTTIADSSFVGTETHMGIVLAENGFAYMLPSSSTSVAKIKPANDSVTTFGSIAGGNKWSGGCLHPNRKIYCAPQNDSRVLVVDTTNDTTSFLGSGLGDYRGICLSRTGNMYCPPFQAATFLKIDPIAGTATQLGSFSGAARWAGAVLAPNGFIYCPPYTKTTVLRINPANDTTKEFGSLVAGEKYFGAVLHQNGKIYAAPYSATRILEIDPISDTAKLVGPSIAGTRKFMGGQLAPNGEIYFTTLGHAEHLRYDPLTDTGTFYGSQTGGVQYASGTVLPDGKLYWGSNASPTMKKVDPATQAFFDTDVILSAYFNKF